MFLFLTDSFNRHLLSLYCLRGPREPEMNVGPPYDLYLFEKVIIMNWSCISFREPYFMSGFTRTTDCLSCFAVKSLVISC